MTLNSLKLFVICWFLCFSAAQAQVALRGVVVEQDSVTPMPFVYIITKGTGNGTMSDHVGKFVITAPENDTLVCSFVGYVKLSVPVNDLKVNAKGEVRLVMLPLPVQLDPIMVTTFKIKPYEREYMNDIIDKSRIRAMDYAGSPVSALYMRYSREGRQIRKLAQIFENLLLEEQVQRKLSPEILANLTGDKEIDYDAFRRYCYYLSNEYIATHDGVELYSRVMECYKQYKRELSRYRRQD